jgi:hypothetical protein
MVAMTLRAGGAMAQDTTTGVSDMPRMVMSGPARMPPMPKGMMMLPAMSGTGPNVGSFLPGAGIDPASLHEATPSTVVTVANGDTFNLDAALVRRTINGRTFVM